MRSIKNNKSFLGCYLHIKTGSGGLDAENWSYILLKMYMKWAHYHNYKNIIIDKYYGISLGIKSVTLQINGYEVYNYLYKETGIHRLVRKNPLKKSHKRHTSFSSVFVSPILPEENISNNINLHSKDIKIDVFRSSGAGGQHVNSTDSAVRLTHIPTGLTTQCQSQRSQHQNKRLALNQLKSKLYLFQALEEDKKNRLIKKLSIKWGNHIRSYVLDDNRIKDLRTGKESRNVKDVLNGKLDLFLIKGDINDKRC